MLVDREVVRRDREVGVRRNLSNLDFPQLTLFLENQGLIPFFRTPTSRSRLPILRLECIGFADRRFVTDMDYGLLCVLWWRFLESSIWYLRMLHFKSTIYMN
jgi:hypothetical protein